MGEGSEVGFFDVLDGPGGVLAVGEGEGVGAGAVVVADAADDADLIVEHAFAADDGAAFKGERCVEAHELYADVGGEGADL